ncbi:MAG: bifunctional UDP-N-acetylglucosamine diphosphorylase/glucosamine-1-phosphate N-acetyltransferase GlmU [Acidimicrobiia bacterium]|nr:bifunctional UDP-N-acetylglucosamine diphosphorylase/glucosamine-1-phosphate N-acetyltransferase GlmU [Acidimicrobiia bacterium]
MSNSVVILAAGKGTRMRTGHAKSLHVAVGRSLLEWALHTAEAIDPGEISVVVGHEADQVAALCPSGVAVVTQEPQLGTGHATSVGLSGLASLDATIVVLPGDMPLVTQESLRLLVATHAARDDAATIMTVDVSDPAGYGRIVRSGNSIVGIVEDRDATAQQRAISEVNTSVYVFDGPLLADAIDKIKNDNDQSEFYLTDVIGILTAEGHSVGAVTVPQDEGMGVNTQGQLAEVSAVLRGRINAELLEAGVAMPDPSRVYIDAGVSVAPGATILPDTYLLGSTTVGEGAVVGPDVEARDSSIAANARVRYSVLDTAVVGERAIVGPYTHLRPGTVLKEGTKAGAYVEIKASVVGKNSKVPHLSYIGDAEIGEDSNVGAATVTVNYDGFNKHKTKIGDRVRIGSDTMLVAPVTIGDDAYTGAGSVITHDVPAGALGVERSDQRIIEGYADKHRKRAEKEAE